MSSLTQACLNVQVEPEPCALVPTLMTFLENHGKNIQLSNQNLTAARVSSYNQGLLVTAQPLARQQLFQVTSPFPMAEPVTRLTVTTAPCWTERCTAPFFHQGRMTCLFFPPHQFQIDRLNPSWTSSLSLGVIGHSPDRLNFPSTACGLKRSAWLLQRDSVFHNSLKVNTNGRRVSDP